MIFEGIYHNMRYKIAYVESHHVKGSYKVRLTSGKKQSLAIASSFAGAVIKLAERIRAWDLEHKDKLMTPEEARKRIGEWKAAWELLQSIPNEEHHSEQTRAALFTIFQASMDLSDAGYEINEDETDWYHPSEEN